MPMPRRYSAKRFPPCSPAAICSSPRRPAAARPRPSCSQGEIDAIIARLPKERQTLLFSATLDGVVGRLAARVTRNPKRIEITHREDKKADITQHALIADNAEHKNRMLDRLLNESEVEQ